MLTLDQITKDDEIILTQIKEIAHKIEIRTLKTLVKKQTVRVKELETQLETLKEENWNNNKIMNVWRRNWILLEVNFTTYRFHAEGMNMPEKILSWMINIILCNKDICIYIYAEN